MYAYRCGCVNRCHIKHHHCFHNLRHRSLVIRCGVYQELDQIMRLLFILPGGIETFLNNRSHHFSCLLLHLMNRREPDNEAGFGVSTDPLDFISLARFSRFQPLWEESDQFSRYEHGLGIRNCVIKICFVSASQILAALHVPSRGLTYKTAYHRTRHCSLVRLF